jgi:D-threo-aldose 1-dehydrogenase
VCAFAWSVLAGGGTAIGRASRTGTSSSAAQCKGVCRASLRQDPHYTSPCMESTALAPGVTSTRIGFGCAGLMREPSGRKRQRLLAEAFDHGITHFDVARMYGLGAAEGELGRFARGRRDSMVIVSKFGIQPASPPGRLANLQGPARWLLARYPALRRYVKRRSDTFRQPRHYDTATARASLETSLRELQTDYVDLLLLHDPSPTDSVDLPDICAFLEETRQAGHVRAWGIAGEQDPCIQIKRSLPATAILQTRDNVLSRARPLTDDLEPLITFGVLGEALDRISMYLKGSRERRSRWSDALGVDCSSSQVLATLLMRDALDANAQGVVLFSTTRPERLQGLDAIAAAHGESDLVLEAFRRRVSDELAPAS